MTETPDNTTDPGAPDPSDVDAIRADIEATRTELADTVEQVADKLNPKTQAAHAKDAAVETASTYRTQILGGLAAGVVALIIVRRLRRRH